MRDHKRQFAQQAAKFDLIEREINVMKRMLQEIYSRLVEGSTSRGTPSFVNNGVRVHCASRLGYANRFLCKHTDVSEDYGRIARLL